MTQIDYDTPQYKSVQKGIGGKESFLIRCVLRTGIVKDKKQANIALLMIACLFFIATLVVLFANGTFSSEGELNQDINYDEYISSEIP